MNVSTSSLLSAPRASVMQAQAALNKAQVELSSGRLADIGTGLGGETGRYVSLNAQQSRLQAIKDSNASTATRLTATTSGLDSLRASATAFLASLTTAATAGSIPASLVATSSSNLSALTATLNTAVDGQSIFAGLNTAVAPLSTYAAGSASKQAVDAAFSSAFGTTQTSSSASSISGSDMKAFLDGPYAALFSASRYASTWSTASDQVITSQISATETVTSSVSANAAPFRQLAQAYAMMKEFGGSTFSSAAGQAVIASATALVSSAVSGLTGIEAAVGTSQSAVSNADDRLTSQIGYLSSQSTDLVGVDGAALATRITGLQTQIRASYEITAQLQQLSLVNFLK